jgi:MarR-like DNA-binding transcriptional regulator SgrR of sgrS sRNA
VPPDPALADAPADAALRALDTAGLCRDTPRGLRLGLARSMTRLSPDQLEVTLADGLQSRKGAPLTALDVVTAWDRLFRGSPYRALFAPIRGGEAGLRAASVGRDRLRLALAYPWPDLERSLCHPALAITVPAGFGARTGVGPFTLASPGHFRAALGFPAGRPFLDRLAVETTDARGAARAFALSRAQVELDGEEGVEGPRRFATYLLFREDRTGPGFRARVETSLDRADLVRLFVRGPAAPLSALLPGAPAPNPPAPLANPPRGQSLTLLYDGSLPSQRPVAERIALKLHDRGYDVRLQGLERAALRERWASGDYELMLQSILLPAQAGPALAVALELGGQHSRLAQELPALGAVADDGEREALALSRASALTASSQAIPLYVQGVRLKKGPKVEGGTLDALGVPDLSTLFLIHDAQLAPPNEAPPGGP